MAEFTPEQAYIAEQASAAMAAGDIAALDQLRASMTADEREAMAQVILSELADRAAR